MKKILYTHNSAQSYFDQSQNVPISASGQNYGDINSEEKSSSLGAIPGVYDGLFLIGDCNKYDDIKAAPSHNNTETEVAEGDFVNDNVEHNFKEIRIEGNSLVNQVSCTSNESIPEKEKYMDFRSVSDKLISDCPSVLMKPEQNLEMPLKASTNLVYSDSANITTKSISCPETDNWSKRKEIEQIKSKENFHSKGRHSSSLILPSNGPKSNENSELIEIPYKITLNDERGSLSVNVSDEKVLDYLKTIQVSNRDATKDHLSDYRSESEDPDKSNKLNKHHKSNCFNNCREHTDSNDGIIANDNLFSCRSLIEIPFKITLNDERGSLSVNVTDEKVLDYLKTIQASNRDATKDHLSDYRSESEDPDKSNKFNKPHKSNCFNNCREHTDSNDGIIANDNLFSCRSLNNDTQLNNLQILDDDNTNSISKDVHSMIDNESSGSSAFESAISSNDTLSILSLGSKIGSVSKRKGKNFNLTTLTSENIPVAMSKMQTQQSVTENIQPEPFNQDLEEIRDYHDDDSITSLRRYRSIVKLLNLTSHKKKNNQSYEFDIKKREKHFDHITYKRRLSSRVGSNHTEKLLIQDDAINTKSEIHENLKSAVQDGIISDIGESANDFRNQVKNSMTKYAKGKTQMNLKNVQPSQFQPNSYTSDQTKKFVSKIPRPVSKKESLMHEPNGKFIHKATNQKPTDSKTTDPKTSVSKITGPKTTDSRTIDPKTTGLKTNDQKTTGPKTTDIASKVSVKQEGRIKPKFAYKFGEQKNTSKEKQSSKKRKDNNWCTTNKTAIISDGLNVISMHETPLSSNCLDMRDRPAEFKSNLDSKKSSMGILSNANIVRAKYWKKEVKKSSLSFTETNMPSMMASSVKRKVKVKRDDRLSVKVSDKDFASASYGTTYGKMQRVKTAPSRSNDKIHKKPLIEMNLLVPDLVLR